MSTSEIRQSASDRGKQSKRSMQPTRLSSYQIPPQLRSSDDAQEDVSTPIRDHGTPAQYMNQSIFGMIAAAGSRTDFNQRFDESSESESDVNTQDKGLAQRRGLAHAAKKHDSSRTNEDIAESQDVKKSDRTSSHRLSQSTPKPSTRSYKSRSFHRPIYDSLIAEKPEGEGKDVDEEEVADIRDAPMMSRLLTAEAKFEASEEMTGAKLLSTTDREKLRRLEDTSPATLLAIRLKEIFGFDRAEKVIGEFPCWLLQSVLLQGYLYLTSHHICFYAYLPKKTNSAAKTGYLSKRGKSNPKYRRYWFELKGDVFTYYSNPSNRYFPHGNIDLRYGISATLVDEKDANCKDLSITTDHRTYFFRADTAASAKEWVKILQKTIFRSHNESDSVKISLLVDNVIDVEDSPVVDFAKTIKIRVVESDDSYAIDEYFFSFSFGIDIMRTLRTLFSDGSSRRGSVDLVSPTGDSGVATGHAALSPGLKKSSPSPRDRSPVSSMHRNVQALTTTTASKDGKMAPRKSAEFKRSTAGSSRLSQEHETRYDQTKFERSRKSDNETRHEREAHGRRTARVPPLKATDDIHDSSTTSQLDKETDSSATAISPTAEADMSASQILSRSDVFHAPLVCRMSTLVSESTEDERRSSEEDNSSPAAQQTHGLGIEIKGGHDRKSAIRAEATSDQPISRLQVPRTSSPTLQDIVRAGTYPLQRAGAFAGYLKNRSERMSKLLATESMSYFEKVSGMWAGGRKHYGANENVVPEDRDVDPEDEEANVGYGDRFRTHFALPSTEKLQATYFGYLHRVLPSYGKIYIGNTKFCFRSLLPGTRTKLVLPLKDIENVDKEKGFRFGYHGLVLVIRGHEELFFEFNSVENRDDCTVTLLKSLESVRYLAESGLLPQLEAEAAEAAKIENIMLQEARRGSTIADPDQPVTAGNIFLKDDIAPILFDDGKASIINFKPPPGLRITCLTIGSRGDVQPFIALCKGFIEEGHKPRIATHAEFGPWIEKHGIEFVSVGGDPAELMRICIENGMFTYSFLKEATSKFRTWIDDLLVSAWHACQDSDILIESPSAMAGIHIAEALGIPYFRAFTMPWTRTRAYPHAFAVPEHKYGGAYNYLSYVMFDNIFWKGISGQINRWRKRDLKLGSTNLERMQQNKVPFLYNYSPHVVPPPLDYSDWVKVTGYWFLDEGHDYKPPQELLNFIQEARADGKKLVYIGFGSMIVADPAALTRTVVDAVLKADVRCILSKGWSDRLGDPSAQKVEVQLPSEIFQIKAAPHDWLFQQIDAAVHHGGAGTTGASLRAGVPTITKPFFGDQFFFGSRLEDLGVGICLKRINVSVLARALWEAVHSERMIIKAKLLGEQIRKENGVQMAIQAIYRDLEYARTLISARKSREHTSATAEGELASTAQSTAGVDVEGDGDNYDEESWTLVEDSDESRQRRQARDSLEEVERQDR